MIRTGSLYGLLALMLSWSGPVVAEDPVKPPGRVPGVEAPEAPAGMTSGRLDLLIRRVDGASEGGDGLWRLTVADHPVTVIADEQADRMRILVPIARAERLDQEMLTRLLEANFDSALDARYSIARDVLWGVFIHPLGSLEEVDFLSGLGQTVNLAVTFGTSYSSGALLPDEGDGEGLDERRLVEELIAKGRAI